MLIKELKMADEFDDTGWAQIHHASQRGFVKSISFFLQDDPDLLELETKDERQLTPFLCAVDGGKTDSIQHLMDAGGKIDAMSAQNHGAIEICAMKQYIEVLEYFMKLDEPKLPVWKHLLRFLQSESDEEADAAGRCLRTLTQGSKAGGINPYWEHVYNNGGIPIIVKVAKSSIGEDAKVPTFQTLLNILSKPEVKEQVASSGGIPVFIRLLKSEKRYLIQLSAEILKEMATVKQYVELEVNNNIIPSLLKVLQTCHDPEVLVQIMDCFSNIANAEPKFQTQIGTTPNLVQTIVNLFEDQSDRAFLYSLCNAVGNICDHEENNQNMFVDNSVTRHIIVLTRFRSKEIQVSAVIAIYKLVHQNPHTQQVVVSENVTELLMELLKKTRAENVQEKTALALWALAGKEFDVKRYLATQIEVNLLIDFVNSNSEDLHFIGLEALTVLAQGPLNYQTEIAVANGIAPLGRLIRSEKEYIVLSVVRAMSALCVGVGFVPHPKNQDTILKFRGIKYLVALMVHSANEEIQVESAIALGSIALGNQTALEDINNNIDFSYVRILKLMYSEDPKVRLLAGHALATFAYNNINQQKVIAEQGGVRFNCFIQFLQSDEEFYRCNAAFQVVVLARIIPDEEQALSSAAGIKLLVDLLQDSESNDILALAADCIARLAHTRAGVPSAIVSIKTVDHLCSLLTRQAEQVRGNAAIALGYLSFNHSAERQILNRCRNDPYLMRILLYYTKQTKISPSFLQAWRHYKRIGLPRIPEGRTNLIGYKPEGMFEDGRPMTMLSFDDTSNTRSSASNLAGEDGRLTGRSSRASRISGTPRHSATPTAIQAASANLRGSQLSLDSQRSQHSLVQQEVTAGD
ncbi:hypothetical protein KUTeg_019887 [Tegillarca granosa]|uniref:Ankyrin and armadillo repeat-containing protein n=1 Tax=Tegillarca granosa TaxID=220873 RepID=A0ABQ9EHZ7_TEGGR|nr:hypothetical protein KUTeg_019887 [Tegillarca granosa]